MAGVAMLVMLAGSASAWAGENSLPRRTWIGAQLVPVATPHNASTPGAALASIARQGPAVAAGLRTGDVIVALDATPIASAEHLRELLRTQRVGTTSTITYLRHGAELTTTITWPSLPSETLAAPDADPQQPGAAAPVEYGTVTTAGGLTLRTLVARPPHADSQAPAGLPAVLYVQDFPCQSIDRPTFLTAPDARLAAALTHAGFVTMRVDRPGTGDSEGAPCNQLDLAGEVAAYAAAVRALGTLEGVDPTRVFVFGHGTGAVVAAQVAQAHPSSVAGLAVYAAPVRSWLEHELHTLRAGVEALGAPDAATQQRLTDASAAITSALTPNATTNSDTPPSHWQGRTAEFFRQLQATNFAEVWSTAKAPRVLVLRGEYDLRTSPQDAQRLAQLINTATPNAATVHTLAGHDAGMTWFDNLANATLGAGRGAWTGHVAQAFVEWATPQGTHAKPGASPTNQPASQGEFSVGEGAGTP